MYNNVYIFEDLTTKSLSTVVCDNNNVEMRQVEWLQWQLAMNVWTCAGEQ